MEITIEKGRVPPLGLTLSPRRVPSQAQPEERWLPLLLPAPYLNQTVPARIPDPLFVFQSRSVSIGFLFLCKHRAAPREEGVKCSTQYPPPVGTVGSLSTEAPVSPQFIMFLQTLAPTEGLFAKKMKGNFSSFCKTSSYAGGDPGRAGGQQKTLRERGNGSGQQHASGKQQVGTLDFLLWWEHYKNYWK